MTKIFNIISLLLLIQTFVFGNKVETKVEKPQLIEHIITEEHQDAISLSWSLNCNLLSEIDSNKTHIVVRYLTKEDKNKLKEGLVEVEWNYTKMIPILSEDIHIENLEGDVEYYFEIGYTNLVDVNKSNIESENIQWAKGVNTTPKSGWNYFKFFILLGALGFFIFGMKTMSEGIQKLAGNKLRNILAAATSNRLAGVATGFTTTSIIQSSSATTVMVVSFVNAGLLTLRQAIGVIMGANIGTTVTSFLLLVFGFGKFNISDYSLPIIAFGMPMLFINRSMIKALGEFLIGFAILFMGLDALKEVMSFIKEDPAFLYNIVEPLSQFGYFSVLLFVLIGTILTIVVQSSSAAMAITLSLCGTNGLSLEYGAAIILGENIGTTITANLAAMVGNVHAKRAARAHLFFNLIGVAWMLVLFYPFLGLIDYLISDTFFSRLVTKGDETSNIQWSLAVYHLVFNIINTTLLIGFVLQLEKMVIKFVKTKGEADEEFKLDFIGGPMGSTAELCILEAKKEVSKFGKVVSRMNTFTKTIINTSDKKEKKKYLKKISKYEEITDRVEEEVVNYIGKVAQMEMTSRTATQTRAMLAISNDLERIGDLYYQMSKSLEKKDEENIWFTPEQREGVNLLISKVDKAFEVMNINLNKEYGSISLEAAIEADKDLNKTRKTLKKIHLESVKDGEFNIKSVLIYNDLIHGLDKVGDHIINVNEAIAGQNLV